MVLVRGIRGKVDNMRWSTKERLAQAVSMLILDYAGKQRVAMAAIAAGDADDDRDQDAIVLGDVSSAEGSARARVDGVPALETADVCVVTDHDVDEAAAGDAPASKDPSPGRTGPANTGRKRTCQMAEHEQDEQEERQAGRWRSSAERTPRRGMGVLCPAAKIRQPPVLPDSPHLRPARARMYPPPRT